MASIRALRRHAGSAFRACSAGTPIRNVFSPVVGRRICMQSGDRFRSFSSASSSTQPPLDVILDLDETLIKARILGYHKARLMPGCVDFVVNCHDEHGQLSS